MRRIILAAAVLVAAPVDGQQIQWEAVEAGGGPRIDIDAALHGLSGAERERAEAVLLDVIERGATGTLKSGKGIVLKQKIRKTASGTNPQIEDWEFTFTYTPTNQIVAGGLFYHDESLLTPSWPVRRALGHGGTLKFQVGLPLRDRINGTEFSFYAHDTSLDNQSRTLTYTMSAKKVGAADPDPPRNPWKATGTGSTIKAIPDDVLDFRIQASYTGTVENLFVYCGRESNSSGLLVAETMGTFGGLPTMFSDILTNQKKYNGTGACGVLDIDGTGITWTLTQVSSR